MSIHDQSTNSSPICQSINDQEQSRRQSRI
jgi:hypothetical protein